MSEVTHQAKPAEKNTRPHPAHAAPAASPDLGFGPMAQDRPLRPDQVLYLQRHVGNRAVARLLNRAAPVVQAKLTVGPAGDHYEQEADRIAAQVINSPAPVQRHDEEEQTGVGLQRSPLAARITPLVQRHHAIRGNKPPQEQEEEGPTGEVQRSPFAATQSPLVQRHHAIRGNKPPQEEEEENMGGAPVQRMPASDLQRNYPHGRTHSPSASMAAGRGDEDRKLQRKGDGMGAFDPGSDFTQRLSSNRGRGRPLGSALRNRMESSFGADFSSVRVHTGPTAVQMSRDIQAQAFTHGADIYFNQGKFNPGDKAGRHLLAHELTHVVQQTGAGVQRKPAQIQRLRTPAQWWRDRKAKKEKEKNTVDYGNLHNIKKGHLLPDTGLMAEPRMKTMMNYDNIVIAEEGKKRQVRDAITLVDDDSFMQDAVKRTNEIYVAAYTKQKMDLSTVPTVSDADITSVRTAVKQALAGHEDDGVELREFRPQLLAAIPDDEHKSSASRLMEKFFNFVADHSRNLAPSSANLRPESRYEGLPGMSQTEAFLDERSQYKFDQVTVGNEDLPRWAAALKQMDTVKHFLTTDKAKAPAKTKAEWHDPGPLTDKIHIVKDARKVGYLGKHADYIDNKRAQKQGFRDRVAQADAMVRAIVEPDQLARVPRPTMNIHTRGAMSYTNPLGRRAGAAAGDLNMGYNEDMETIAHELGHIIEEYMPMDAWHDIHMLLNERHKAKGGGKYARRGENIFTYFSEGRYGGDYVTGKYTTTAYSKDNAEVVSMWMQFMASPEKATRLIDGDPQHAALVLRAMRPEEYNGTPALRPFDKYLPMKKGEGPLDRYKSAQEKVEKLYKDIGTGG